MPSTYGFADAKGYERIMGRFSAGLARRFLEFSEHPAGEKILDVGCGTGSMSFALAERGDHESIVGIDVSDGFVAYAKSQNRDDRTQFEVGDATSLPYDDGHFDRAVSQLVLQFLPDPFPAVEEISRVVRPGGTVTACVWDSFGGLPHIRVLWDSASALGLDRERSLLRPLSTQGELEAMWRRAGLASVQEDIITTRFLYDDFNDYWSSFLHGDGPPTQMLRTLDNDQISQLEQQVRHVFLSGKPDGRRSFFAVALICKGTVTAH